MPRYEDGNNPDSKREKVPANTEKTKRRARYPLGGKMAKGSKLDCMGCNRDKPNPKCKGCGGKGYIVV